ncbi:hypothetical protein T265_15154, partial [Opisthorchis viverrini]
MMKPDVFVESLWHGRKPAASQKIEYIKKQLTIEENVGSSGSVDGGRWLVRWWLCTTTNPPLHTPTLHNNALMMSPGLVMKRLQSNCPAQRTSQRPDEKMFTGPK